jgi:hypothetical protein
LKLPLMRTSMVSAGPRLLLSPLPLHTPWERRSSLARGLLLPALLSLLILMLLPSHLTPLRWGLHCMLHAWLLSHCMLPVSMGNMWRWEILLWGRLLLLLLLLLLLRLPL